ncbi:hypothetical protein [Candidatus Uabimicrobium sp. HlEnr_7]|uniref:hypothetical protein n=1 Tax=Candidatus Uabimicrobium helgolandensis TaxID=3095367 RepID=UPI003558D5E3
METKKKKLFYDVTISIGLIFYICLTTLIFINHKRIVQLRKQIENVDNSSKNIAPRKQKNISSQKKQQHLQKNIKNSDVVGHLKLGVDFMGKVGSEKEAIKHFKKVLQADPDNKNKKTSSSGSLL